MEHRNLINSKTLVLGIIGHPIEHSLSPIMQNAAIYDLNLNYRYFAFDVPPKHLKKALEGARSLNFKGLNITIPHKQNVLSNLENIDPIAKKIGAVNTIKNENGKLIGKNTDAIGAKISLDEACFSLRNKKSLILGAGGAARAVSFGLAESCEEIIISNRTNVKGKGLVNDLLEKTKTKAKFIEYDFTKIEKTLNRVDLLVNATPIGMFPRTKASPIPKEILKEHLFVFDLIYNPIVTKLLQDAKDIGCKTLNGVNMLVNQGALALEWWVNEKPNKKLMEKKILEALKIHVRR